MIIAFDLDGTLLKSDSTMSPFTQDTLKLMKKLENELVPCTDRTLENIPSELLEDGLCRYLILNTGKVVYDALEKKVIFENSEATKGDALLWLSESLNVIKPDVLFFGDGEDDISVMQHRFETVAMINGSPKLRSLAKYTTQVSNNRDGMPIFLREYFYLY